LTKTLRIVYMENCLIAVKRALGWLAYGSTQPPQEYPCSGINTVFHTYSIDSNEKELNF